jgi:hypothetical protein
VYTTAALCNLVAGIRGIAAVRMCVRWSGGGGNAMQASCIVLPQVLWCKLLQHVCTQIRHTCTQSPALYSAQARTANHHGVLALVHLPLPHPQSLVMDEFNGNTGHRQNILFPNLGACAYDAAHMTHQMRGFRAPACDHVVACRPLIRIPATSRCLRTPPPYRYRVVFNQRGVR